MKRPGYLGLSLFLLFTFVVSPGFAQQAQQAQQTQWKTTQEYNGYMAAYEQKDPAKKAEAAEKFVAEFKDSQVLGQAYTMMISAYRDSKNWAKVMDSADRYAALPVADDKGKVYAYVNAMNAAQNSNNVDKVISYGDKVLALDPNELNTMITMAMVIPAKLPTDPTAQKAAMDKANDLATKALTGLQPLIAKAADPQAKLQLEQLEGTMHSTRGLIAYNRLEYQKSIEEYEDAIKKNKKDDVAHFYIALNYQTLGAKAYKDYLAAVDEENKAKREKAEQPVLEELAAKSAALTDDVKKARDKAIDEFAIAVAVGGQVSAQAKDALTKLWTVKNDGTSGLDEFIAEKKKQYN